MAGEVLTQKYLEAAKEVIAGLEIQAKITEEELAAAHKIISKSAKIRLWESATTLQRLGLFPMTKVGVGNIEVALLLIDEHDTTEGSFVVLSSLGELLIFEEKVLDGDEARPNWSGPIRDATDKEYLRYMPEALRVLFEHMPDELKPRK